MGELMGLMGAYALQGTNLILTFVEYFICIALFARKAERRRLFPLRIAAVLISGVLLCYLLAVWYTLSDTLLVRVLCYTVITLFSLLGVFFCWQGSPEELLLAFCSGMAAYQFTNKLYPLLQAALGINYLHTLSLIHPLMEEIEEWEWIYFFLFHVIMFVVLAALFTPKSRLVHNRRTTQNVILLSVSTVVLVNILICISRTFEAQSLMLAVTTMILYIVLSLIVLLTCAGIFSQSEQEQQLATIQQLWRQDKAQFESVKANIDIINMKCHDLKHILNRIEDKLTDEEAVSLREAIEFYDSNIRTGNEVLDVVLCEKALICQKNGINFSCMADGAKLGFLSPVQIYSLFGNIIDNAIEAVKRLDAPEDKVISLICRQEGDALILEESNYFAGTLEVKDGVPSTSKHDASRHGYGTRSIQYIAEQYGGIMGIKIVGNMFFLTIRFPLHRG